MEKLLNTTLNNFNNNENIPNDFDYRIYYYLNDDLQIAFTNIDKNKLYEHWINYGYNENREYKIPFDILNNFDYRIYYYLYDDIQNEFNYDEHIKLLCHYYREGRFLNRICNINRLSNLNNLSNEDLLDYYKTNYTNKLLIFKNIDLYDLYIKNNDLYYDYIISDDIKFILTKYKNKYKYYYFMYNNIDISIFDNINLLSIMIDSNLLLYNEIINDDIIELNDIKLIKNYLISNEKIILKL